MRRIAIASFFGLGLLGITAASSGAAPMASPQQGVTGTAPLLQEASTHSRGQNTRRSWKRDRDGDRCRKRSGHCRHYHNGYWYASPWWTLPLIGGSIILNSQNRNFSSRHIAWCEDRYRSYDRRTNTWVAYSGTVRQCVSPYGR